MNKIKLLLLLILNIVFILFLNFYLHGYNSMNVSLFLKKDTENNDAKVIQPVLSSVGVSGGDITVSNLNSFNISDLIINFQSIQYRKHTFQCFNQIKLTDTSIQCSIPKGFGTYIVLVQDNHVKSQPLYWSYKLGQISKKNSNHKNPQYNKFKE
ncbi:hypothetical protein ACTA71_000628 [Dictyostelium dimigraforme]